MVDSHLVYGYIGVVIGAVIGPAIDVILHHIGIVVRCKNNLESLEDKVKKLDSVLIQLEVYDLELDILGDRKTLAIKKWVEKLKKLHGDASKMVHEWRSTLPRINVVSRYQRSNKITQKISDIDKQLKYIPLIELELLIWQSLKLQFLTDEDAIEQETFSQATGFEAIIVRALVNKSRDLVIDQILGHITIVFRFKTELESLHDLEKSIRPIFTEIQQFQDFFRPLREKEWFKLKGMTDLLNEAREIESVPWWNVVDRYKKGKKTVSLISAMEANVNLASVINLIPILDGIRSVQSLRKCRASRDKERQLRVKLRRPAVQTSSAKPDAETFNSIKDVKTSSDREGIRAPLLGGP